MKGTGDYTDDWPEIAACVKEEAGNACIRCRHPHEPAAGYCLTVHHLDGRKDNNRWWNLAALCQRCHLNIQGRVIMSRPWLFEHSDWMRPLAAGYYAHQFELPDTREFVQRHIDALLYLACRRSTSLSERLLAALRADATSQYETQA
jgi:hypothetical protein